ncbi:hemerythrin domain-containing protein [Aromatoleum evansii]|nr:hemerythrin domain-containing protein [Aromatoleum evansii]NMG30770.1 hemerythrin domain-containing protein [Aromatoleum evansii]
MFLLDKLFGRFKGAAPAAAAAGESSGEVPVQVPASPPTGAAAPGTQIRHDPGLVPALMRDHVALLEIHSAIAAALDGGRLDVVRSRLDEFRAALMDHLLKENVRLYVYLEHFLRGDAVSHRMMREFRHEMDVIGRAVVDFLGKYKELGQHPELAGPFRQDLAAIGKALVSRIRREEEILYPMYLPAA